MHSDEYEKIEQHLTKNSNLDTVLHDPIELAKTAQKKQRSQELLRLGVFGVFSMLLVLFAPLLMKHKVNSANKKGKSL